MNENKEEYFTEEITNFKNGDVRSIKRYKNGLKHGEHIGYFSHGGVRWRQLWVDGIKVK